MPWKYLIKLDNDDLYSLDEVAESVPGFVVVVDGIHYRVVE
jgi:hypothetical protein